MVLRRSLLVASTLLVMAVQTVQAQDSTTGTSTFTLPAATSGGTSWGVSFYNLASAPANQLGDDPAIFNYSYLALNYKLSKTRRLSLRPVYQYTTSGRNEYGDFKQKKSVLGDAHLVYADYEIAALGPANVSTSFKMYLPTSDSSRENGMLMKFRPETFISIDLGSKDSITYSMKPDFYFQSRASNFDSRGREFKTNVFVLEHALEYAYNLNRTFKVKPSVGFTDTWGNPTKNVKANPRKTEAKLALGLDIAAMKGLNFTLSVENEFAVSNRRDEVAIMRPNENSLVLITSASL